MKSILFVLLFTGLSAYGYDRSCSWEQEHQGCQTVAHNCQTYYDQDPPQCYQDGAGTWNCQSNPPHPVDRCDYDCKCKHKKPKAFEEAE